MLIESMTRQVSIDLLARTNLGRLACVHDGQPYITPIAFAYDDNHLHAFSTLGQKIAWMRANPRVCVEADELVTRQDWATVIVIGRYQEFTDSPEDEDRRIHSYKLLQRNPVWWEPGGVKTLLEGTERPVSRPIYFRIHIDQISGHRGVPDTVAGHPSPVTKRSTGWFQKILGRAEHH